MKLSEIMKKRILTKRPMVYCSIRMSAKIKELWRSAAAQEEVSQSEFLHNALRDKAKSVLLGGKEGQMNV